MYKFLVLLFLPLLLSAQQKPKTFKKIIFHTSMCFGKCPVYHLQVEKNKQVKLYAEHVYTKDTMGKVVEDSSKIGYFKGKVDNGLYNALVAELQKINLDSLQLNGPTCCDGSVISMIIYYGSKRKSGQSMFPPEELRPLIGILTQICQSPDLKRSKKRIAIEKVKEAPAAK